MKTFEEGEGSLNGATYFKPGENLLEDCRVFAETSEMAEQNATVQKV